MTSPIDKFIKLIRSNPHTEPVEFYVRDIESAKAAKSHYAKLGFNTRRVK
jgi:hypothetical protein